MSREHTLNKVETVLHWSSTRGMKGTGHSKIAFCLFHSGIIVSRVLRYIAHLWRRGKRRLMKRYRVYLYKRQQKREQNLLKEQQQHGHPFRGGAPGPDPNRLPGGKFYRAL